ncbi:MAG TPA: Calx-beta domain-containing protein [Solirubrobacteraceae bacterium]|nr:Calx-beta domain-containing protein [Solirubrobacteraceae bacterium]
MHRRAVRTLIAALAAALLAPAAAGAYVVSPATNPEGDVLVFEVALEGIENPAAEFDPQGLGATEGVDFDGEPVARDPVSGEVRIPVTEDDLDEDDETLKIVGPGGDEGTGTITDDDAPPALSIADVTVLESAGAAAKATITAKNPSEEQITIPLATSGGADLSVPASVVLPAEARSVDVPLNVVNDFDDEPDEPFSVFLGTPTGGAATVADGEGIVTIGNDDLRVVDVMDASTPEGDAGSSNAQFAVRLNAPTFRTVTVRYATADGLAKAPGDYLGRLGTLTFPPGHTVALVDVPVVPDDRQEPAEAFAFIVSDVTNARPGDLAGVGVIVDDDSPTMPGGGTTPADVTPPRITLGPPKASGRRVTLRVSCPSSEDRCAGRITLFTVPDRRSKARSLRREVRLGAKSFSLSGGAAKTVAVTIPSSVVRAARRAGRLKLAAFAVTQDAAENYDTRSRRATLRYGRRRSR